MSASLRLITQTVEDALGDERLLLSLVKEQAAAQKDRSAHLQAGLVHHHPLSRRVAIAADPQRTSTGALLPLGKRAALNGAMSWGRKR